MTEHDEASAAFAAPLLEEIGRLMRSHTDRREEARILAILGSATAEELDWLIRRLDIRALLSDVDDRLLGPRNRTALVELLTVGRLADLGTEARAALIAGLQRGRTGSWAEQAVRRIVLGTCGEALTRLKNALDAGSDHRDLHQLVFHDIDDDGLREEILAHIAEEAVPAGEVKILSDIDDTFYANWKDQRYPAKTVYPGVLQLYIELDRGPGEASGRAGDITFVTARPGDRLGLVEAATRASLGERGLAAMTVLTGSLRRIIGNRAIAEKKVENFVEYRRLYPEYDFVFIGDSGQGDIHFGRRMLELAAGAVKGVFIHDVVATPAPERRSLAASGVLLFDTYIGAAADALALRLIHAEGAMRVAQAAQSDLAAISFASEPQRADREAELAGDLARLRSLLPDP
jgi:hypothetical protein